MSALWEFARRRNLIASLTSTIAANLPVFLTGSLAVQMQRDLDYGDTELGIAIGVFFAAGALASPSMGAVVSRVGAQRSLRAAAILSAVAQLIICGVARSFVVLVAVMAIGGLANAWAQPASNVFLVGIVPARRLGLALGLQKSAIPAAALLGGLAVPLARSVGWRWAFLGGALFAVLAAVQVPAEPRRPPPRPRMSSTDTATDTATDTTAIDTTTGTTTGIAKPDSATRALAVLALGVGLGSSASNALSAFVVRGGVDVGLGESSAAVLLALGSVMGIAVRLSFGARADRQPGKTLHMIAWLFIAAAGAFALLATNNSAVFIVATPLAFATGYAWPGLFHLAVIRSNPSAPGTATGIAMTGTLAGAVVGPMLFGAIADHLSFSAAWATAAVMLTAAATVVAAASRHITELPAPASLDDSVPVGGLR